MVGRRFTRYPAGVKIPTESGTVTPHGPAMHPTAAAAAWRVVLGLFAVCAVGGVGLWTSRVYSLASRTPADQAADALPLFLGVEALREGADPTDAGAFANAYSHDRLQVGAAVFSTLYPASTSVLLEPLVPVRWPRFVAVWRGLLILSAIIAGAAGAMAGTPPRRWWLAAPVGALSATLLFPVTSGAVILGQMNQLLAALAGLAQLALALDFGGVAIAFLVVGGGLKLVPAFATWPFFASRRGWALTVGLVVGLVLLGLTSAAVPLPRAVAALIATLRFESEAGGMPGLGVDLDSPPLLIYVVVARHVPMAIATITLAGVAAWRARGRSEVLVGGVALIFAWLAADASGQHALYLPLGLASLAWAASWPLAPGAPTWTRALPPLLVLPFALVYDLPYPAERVGLFGMVAVWVVVALRTFAAVGPLGRGQRVALWIGGVLALVVAAQGPRVVPMDGRVPSGEGALRPLGTSPGEVAPARLAPDADLRGLPSGPAPR